ncbi:MAG: 6,7-dimethyl-8-ribityllumazine synthase [Kordiimonadaceae bacterium]|nr:6,7-dimethyl-8-ribityllumazine synthase [Kordiimonadaceae bacterium]MBO6570396.1 6,7-dimethyl-8-ribityllumazine synthase [Kordiimonadaceae bacterium]MBO6965506.1 6,7-dimethyl-8-ribityllumazine synthase [Kordiimonadaceae bacterium]
MANPHILIVEARFYEELADELVAGAIEAVEAAGGTWERIDVPGALEIPAAISMADAGDAAYYDGYVALGCVIRGETSHYDYVCGESARALQDLAVQDLLAVGNGILTVEDSKQAWARANRSEKNKGADAANAAIRMAELKRKFGAIE